MEAFQVQLPYLSGPRWLATRYWLTIDLDARGRLDSVAVRTDRDTTWDAEGDDDDDYDRGRPFISLAERFSEEGYSAVCEVLEHRRDAWEDADAD